MRTVRVSHYSADQLMTALCLAEAMVFMRHRIRGTEPCKELDDLFDAHGVFTMREAAITLLDDADAAWEAGEAMGVDNLAFDAEFCFDFIRTAAADGRLHGAVAGTYGTTDDVHVVG